MDGGNKATEQQQVNTFRSLMAEMSRVVRAKDLAEGHPVQMLPGTIIDGEFNEVRQPDIKPDIAALPAPTETATVDLS
jgi:hypothetical protein